MRRRSILFSALAVGSALPAMAQADYPNKPLTLLVGYPPGGSTDLTARLVAAELAQRLKQPVIVENIGGSGGTIAAQKVALAPADGYTLLLGSNNEMAISKLVNPRVRYDAVSDFTPIGMVASQPMVLVASQKSGIKTVDEFLAQVRKNPGKYSYGSSGVGTALHLAAEMVKESAGTFIVHIPYRGVAPLTNDLIGGQLEFGVFVLSSGLPHIRSGKVVALGLTEARPSKAAPDILPLANHPALKKVDIGSWFGLWAPPALPAPLQARLQKTLAEALVSPELRRKLEEAGATPATPGFTSATPGLTSATPGVALGNFQKSEIEKFARIVKFANIQE